MMMMMIMKVLKMLLLLLLLLLIMKIMKMMIIMKVMFMMNMTIMAEMMMMRRGIIKITRQQTHHPRKQIPPLPPTNILQPKKRIKKKSQLALPGTPFLQPL